MSEVERAIITPLENLIAKLPFGTEPLGRGLYGAGLGAALVFGFKPDFMFTKDGKEKQWIVFDPKGAKGTTTIFPWWAGVALPGIILGVFV